MPPDRTKVKQFQIILWMTKHPNSHIKSEKLLSYSKLELYFKKPVKEPALNALLKFLTCAQEDVILQLPCLLTTHKTNQYFEMIYNDLFILIFYEND